MNHFGRDAFLILMVLFTSMLACSEETAQAELRVEIGIEQPIVNNNEEVAVLTKIRNLGVAEQSIRLWSCSYSQQWTSDNPAVHIKGAACKKNDVVQVKLKPGQTYERKLLVRIVIPNKHLPQGKVHFRLGFRVADTEEKPIASAIWSNSVMIGVAFRGI